MYEYYNPNPKNKQTGDCVVRALCKALDKSWDEVYILLCVQGFIDKDWGNVNSVWADFPVMIIQSVDIPEPQQKTKWLMISVR